MSDKDSRKEEWAIDPEQFPKSYLNISYAEENEEQKMDIFLPDKNGIHPVVIFVHGGGWYFGGRREECISSVFKIVSQGYAVATIDYRLAPDSQWPAQINDVKTAISYLIKHADKFQLDTRHLVLWGNSAGAHLAQMAAATQHTPYPEDSSYEKTNYNYHIDGLISWYGVTDFLSAEKILNLETGDSLRELLTLLLGFDIYDNPEGAMEACSLKYIDSTFPKTLIQHGTKDHVVPYQQSEELYDRITEKCGENRAVLELFAGADHGAPEIKADTNINRCLDFLDEIYFAESKRPHPRTTLPELKFVITETGKKDPYEAAI